MTPAVLPQHNAVFTAPPDLDHTQVFSIHAFKGVIPPGYTQEILKGEVPPGSNLDGAPFVVTGWKPSPEELEELNRGGSIYLSCLGGLPAHFLTTDFNTAVYGQG